MIINIVILQKLRYMLKGRQFIIRSTISSMTGEVPVTLAIYPFVYHQDPWAFILLMMANSYAYKIVFSTITAPIAKLIVTALRKTDGIKDEFFNADLSRYAMR